MIMNLLLVSIETSEWVIRALVTLPAPLRRLFTRLLKAMRAFSPASLGTPFDSE
jgi:hypothetical protein